jgi:tetratricopeptide (TPR) repeat protein
MKKTRRPRQVETQAAEAAAAPRKILWWPWAAAAAALFVVFEIYSPALPGPFVLDDRYLPFANPRIEGAPLMAWIAGLRPVLMFSYWINYSVSGTDPYMYHATNVFLHFLNAVLVALIAMRLLKKAGLDEHIARPSLGVFAGALFLVHPIQTEAVAYVASRSDVLAAFFYYAAFCVFLYRGPGSIGWLRTLAILVLFGAAVSTKEHTLTLPILLLLTDLYWNPRGLKENRLLYVILAVLTVAGGVEIWRILAASGNTAGFNVREFTPASYFFTQARVVWTYARMILLPFGQNVDPEVDPSRTLLEHGALIALLAWIALAAAALYWRKRWPLASYGVFVFLLLIAPTSSVVPIQDAMAERRVYLPFLGAALICLEFLRRMPLKQRAMIEAPVLVVLMIATYQRSAVWSSPMALWQDTVNKSPHKLRPRSQLAYVYFEQRQYQQAAENYEVASHLTPPDYPLLVNWGQSLAFSGHLDEALDKFQTATKLEWNPQAWALVGMVYGMRNQPVPALDALSKAERANPNFEMTYYYRGNVYSNMGNQAAAAEQYQHALALNPSFNDARQALMRVQKR